MRSFFLILFLAASVWAWPPDAQAGGRVPRAPGRGLDECDSLFALTVRPEGQTVRLSWYDLPGVAEWVIYRSASHDMVSAEIAGVVRDTCTWLESDSVVARSSVLFYRVAARWTQGDPDNYAVIEDFDQPVALLSYGSEDEEPNAWAWEIDGAYQPYQWCLELNGNTWKQEVIDTVALAQGTTWRIAVKAVTIGEGQAFGIADSANELWFALWGREVRQSEAWDNTYQGWFGTGTWALADLPVGDTWAGRFGYYGRITRLLFANDNDGASSSGVLRIDEIRDVTGTLSIPPYARFRWWIAGQPGPDSVDVAFCSMGCDPEGPLYGVRWTLGDGTTSSLLNPVHRYPAGRLHRVCFVVTDSAGRVDWTVADAADTDGVASREFTALFTGDVMMARRYEDPGGIIPTYGVNAIFDRVRPLVSSVDLAMCNLECPLTTATTRHPTKAYAFKGRPEYVEGLTYAGFDLCALANNHNFDYLEAGMDETKHVLDSVGLLSTGAGENEEIAALPVFYSLNGLCVAVLSFCNRDGSFDNEQPFLGAGPGRPGFAMWDRTNIERWIPRVRESADLLIVQVHSGIEYATLPPALASLGFKPDDERVATFSLLPDTSDMSLRHLAVDLGADLLVNHHPHVLQGCEVYHGKLITHSMGNFAFDQQFPETFHTVAISTRLADAAGTADIVVHPIFIDRYIPTPASGSLAAGILDYLTEVSRPMHAWVVRVPFADTASLLLDTSSALLVGSDRMDTLTLVERGDWAVSAPFALVGGGYPTQMAVLATPGAEYRAGRELLWYGNMEAEGATQWDLNSNYERYDTTVSHGGHRSIGLNRAGGGTNSVSTNLIYRYPYSAASEQSLTGWMRGTNARDAALEFEFYNYRTGGTLLLAQAVGGPTSGTFGWTAVWADLDAPDGSAFCNLRLRLRAPASGDEGFAWFDDLAWIRWDEWQTQPGELPFPNSITYVQVRAPIGTAQALVSYRREWVDNSQVVRPPCQPVFK